MERHQVGSLGESERSARHWLMTEFMRPPEGSAAWREVLASAAHDRAEAARGLTLVEAGDREEEALVIALMLRESCESPGRTACLITPDRDLARRVKQELSRWSIAIDDTAGQPLIGFAGPTLLALLIDVVDSGYALAPLHALLRHPLATLGLDPPRARRAASLHDLALFRRGTGWPKLRELEAAFTRNHAEIAADPHAHPAFLQFAEADWAMAEEHLRAAVTALHRLAKCGAATLAGHLDALQEALETFAGAVLWSDEPGAALLKLLGALKAESSFAGVCDAGRAMAVIRHHLVSDVLRPSRGQSPRLAIYGLLEARLMRADLHILGGLNEGVWPALPDSGPWLNRPMREKLRMPLPEKAIGQRAHDLVQAMGAGDVRLVWSRRIGDKPAIPSRWVLRLNLLLNGVLPTETPSWLRWARQLRHVENALACSKPKPCPPVAARPASISVTQVENLIRDPYGFYAKRVLTLEPLPDIAAAPDYALRGTLYHEAIGKFLARHPYTFPQDALDQLLAIGRDVFAPHFDIPLISAFWWPRFQRIARWLATEDRSPIAATHAEISGAHTFDVAGKSFKLTGRADRIDILASGEVEIIDYKTGKVPSKTQVDSGFAPQLPLEAAMVMQGAFKKIGKRQVAHLCYVRITGKDPPAEKTEPKLDWPVGELATHSLERLRELLERYANPKQPYLPRYAVEKEDDVLDHDHLSRYLEWRLSGRFT
jgi:ATP-dependent helicase/nuclease subunit B